MPEEICYMCDAVKTSNEHVPPRCLFPKAKELEEGEDLRKELITVPSCDLHNAAKSLDDEFLMISISGIVGNNSIGYRHYQGRANRALRKRSKSLLDRVMTNRRRVKLPDGDNEFYNIVMGTPDYHRLVSCFEHIAFGIYHHHFGERFVGQTKIIMGFLHNTDKNSNSTTNFIRDKSAIELEEVERQGSNPGVFYYQFGKPDDIGLTLLRLTFYDGVDVYASFVPEGTSMGFDLGQELIKDGIRTTVTLGDKKYEFNEDS